MKNKSKLLTTLSIGASLGTLTSATMFVGAAVLIVFILPVLFIPYIAWVAWAWVLQSRGCLPSLSVTSALLLALIAVPVAVYLPQQLSSLEMKVRAADTPLPDEMTVTAILPDPVGNSTLGPGVIFRLQPDDEILRALNSYSEQLEQEGWRKVAGDVPSAVGFNVSLLFSSPDYKVLGVRAMWNRTLHKYEGISVRFGLTPYAPGVLLAILAAAFILLLGLCVFRKRSENDNSN